MVVVHSSRPLLPISNIMGGRSLGNRSMRRGKKMSPNCQYYRILFPALCLACFLLLFMTQSKLNPPIATTEPVDYNVVVIGSGPAGLSAALYAARSGWSVLLVGSMADSQLSRARILDNLPGYHHTGLQWLQDTHNQLQQYSNIHFAQPGLRVSRLSSCGAAWCTAYGISTNQNLDADTTLHSHAVILASGSVPRRLDLAHEPDLWGRHVHSCAVCDGSAYGSNDTVVVIGGGDGAIDAVLLLQRTTRRVVLVHRQRTFRATNRQNVERAKGSSNVELLTPFVVTNYVVESGTLVGVEIKDTASGAPTQRVACNGVFLLLGATPNTDLVAAGQLRLDADGYVATPQTFPNGLFVAGDVADKVYHQAITAAGSGAQAALDAEAWLRQQGAAIVNSVNNSSKIPLQPRRPPSMQEKKHSSSRQTEAVDSSLKRKEDSSCDLHTRECLQSIISQHPVVVFSKPWCPYCKKALQAIAAEQVLQPHVVDLVMSDASRIQQELARLSNGRRTVPNVFIGGKSVGGGDETAALHRSGQLKAMLQDAKASMAS